MRGKIKTAIDVIIVLGFALTIASFVALFISGCASPGGISQPPVEYSDR